MLGPIDSNPCCCPPMPGTYTPITPYVVSLNGLSGILTINGQGAIDVSAVGGSIMLSLSAAAGLGTVTSVQLISSATSAISFSGGPITTAGSITMTIDPTLVAFAGVTVAADTLVYGSGADTFSVATFSAVGRTLIAQPTQALARTTGLGATTVGGNLFVLPNPSAINFIRINADNTVTGRTASGMRSDLGLVPGTDVQAWDADLQIISNNSGTVSNTGVTYNVNAVNANSDIISNSKLMTDGPASVGNDLLLLRQNSINVFEVRDNGLTTLTIDPAFGGGTVWSITANSTVIATIDDVGLATFTDISAGTITGDGAAITGLNATQLTSGTVPTGRIAGVYTGITGLGTIASGTWNAGLIPGQYGGTGVANTGKTITLGGNLTTSGAFATTLTVTAATAVTLPTSGTLYGTLAGSITSAQLASSLTDETGSGSAVFATSAALLSPTITNLNLDKTITGSGTTGNQTINKTSGSVRFAALATSLTITNSLATANSVCMATVGSNDTTLKSVQAVCASGTITLFANAAATAETIVYFVLTN